MTMPPIPAEGNPAEYVTRVRALEAELANCTHLLAAAVHKAGGKIVIKREELDDQDKVLHVHGDSEAGTITMSLEDR